MVENKSLLIILALFTIIGLISYLGSPFFEVQNIHINDLEYISRQGLQESLSSYQGRNIWLIDKNQIQSSLQKNNYIKRVQINKKIPDTINIFVEERRPVAAINNNGRFVVFDQQGFILEEGALNVTDDVPLLQDIAYSFLEQKIVFTDDIEVIIQALSVTDKEVRSGIKKLIYQDQELQLELNSGEVRMGGLDQLEKKFKVFNTIMDRQLKAEAEVEYIDLRIVEKPVIK